MPGNNQPKRRASQTDATDDAGQPRVSRRSLLGVAGVSAAGLAAGAFGGLGSAQAATAAKPAASSRDQGTSQPAQAAEPAEQPSADEHVVVHVQAGTNGDIHVYRGTSETRLQDPDLAARLRRAAP
jgi:nitrous oxide reductase